MTGFVQEADIEGKLRKVSKGHIHFARKRSKRHLQTALAITLQTPPLTPDVLLAFALSLPEGNRINYRLID
jgi:hypothetical protein